MKDTTETIRDLVKIQGQDGNWNYDLYMQGMYNGLELALAVLEGREPVYKQAPDIWLKDILMPEGVEAVPAFNETREG